jgi:hypothetical protein
MNVHGWVMKESPGMDVFQELRERAIAHSKAL